VTTKARILLVDDRSENLVALEAILSSLNQVLVPVRSGEEALKALLTDEFAVILLDVVMPGMDGFETAAHIKRRLRTRDVPIIFLTAASSEPDHAFRGYAAGAVDYISKPFDPWVLRAKVSVFVELYVKNRQLREQAELLRSQLDSGRGAARRALTSDDGAAGSGSGPATGDGADGEAATEAPPSDDQTGPDGEEAGTQPLLLELSGRLAAVEDAVGVLSGQAAVSTDMSIGECVAQLEHRVGRLRDALDALRVG
jgi:CheY-like chemotaxis protein